MMTNVLSAIIVVMETEEITLRIKLVRGCPQGVYVRYVHCLVRDLIGGLLRCVSEVIAGGIVTIAFFHLLEGKRSRSHHSGIRCSF